jgi:NAD-reducing hydrogenase small subunit
MGRVKLATMWLGGCSGCHMSFLDLDELLIDLADQIDVVFGPLVDAKVYPEEVDICLVEGAVCNVENREWIERIRARTKVLIAFGDCAVTANVPAMRNPLPDSAQAVLARSYLENGDLNARIPAAPVLVPVLLPQVLPVHAVVPVDIHLPGCPPSAARIREVLTQLLAGQSVQLHGPEMLRFG